MIFLKLRKSKHVNMCTFQQDIFHLEIKNVQIVYILKHNFYSKIEHLITVHYIYI